MTGLFSILTILVILLTLVENVDCNIKSESKRKRKNYWLMRNFGYYIILLRALILGFL